MSAAIARVKNKPTTFIAECDASLAAEDWVYQHPTVTGKVLKATNNLTPTPIIGFVVSKPTTTTAEVVLVGLVEKDVGGTGRVFAGASGQAVLSDPGPGYLQTLGESFGDSVLFVNPNLQRVKRI